MTLHCARCNRSRKMVPMDYQLCGKCKLVVKIMDAKRQRRLR